MADSKVFQELIARDDFAMGVALGCIAGTEPEVKFGQTPIATNAVRADVGENAAAQPIYLFPPDAGDSIELFAAGTDTQDITIEGLNPAGVVQTETVTLSGVAGAAGAVAVPGVWRAVQRAYNDDSTDLVSAVTIRKVGDGARVYASIGAINQQTAQTQFVVPAGKIALINNFSTAVNKSGGASTGVIFEFRSRKPGKVFRTLIRYGLQREGTSNISSDLVVPILVGPLSQIKVSATPDGTNADISAEYSMWLIDAELVPPELLAAFS